MWGKCDKWLRICALVGLIVLLNLNAEAITVDFSTSQSELYINQPSIIEININSSTANEKINRSLIRVEIPPGLRIGEISKEGFLGNASYGFNELDNIHRWETRSDSGTNASLKIYIYSSAEGSHNIVIQSASFRDEYNNLIENIIYNPENKSVNIAWLPLTPSGGDGTYEEISSNSGSGSIGNGGFREIRPPEITDFKVWVDETSTRTCFEAIVTGEADHIMSCYLGTDTGIKCQKGRLPFGYPIKYCDCDLNLSEGLNNVTLTVYDSNRLSCSKTYTINIPDQNALVGHEKPIIKLLPDSEGSPVEREFPLTITCENPNKATVEDLNLTIYISKDINIEAGPERDTLNKSITKSGNLVNLYIKNIDHELKGEWLLQIEGGRAGTHCIHLRELNYKYKNVSYIYGPGEIDFEKYCILFFNENKSPYSSLININNIIYFLIGIFTICGLVKRKKLLGYKSTIEGMILSAYMRIRGKLGF